jgi:hypothetical protein
MAAVLTGAFMRTGPREDEEDEEEEEEERMELSCAFSQAQGWLTLVECRSDHLPSCQKQ